MTILSTASRVQYTAAGSTTAFAFPYLFYDNTHLKVWTTDADEVSTLHTLETDYTVTGAGVAGGGTVTFLSAPTSGHRVTIQRVVPGTQTLDLVNNSGFDADLLEKALDFLAMQAQQAADSISRSILLPATSSEVPPDPDTFVSTLNAIQASATAAASSATASAIAAEAAAASITIGVPGGAAQLDSESKVVQDPASKGLANGVAGLNSNANIPGSFLEQRAYHQCYFQYVSPTECRFIRDQGKWVTIDDTPQEIPEAGVSITPTGSTVGTVYYAYAYMSSGVMTLMYSTTVPVLDSRNGMMVMTGDAAKTLVGMFRPASGPVFVDSASQRFVLSHYNKRQKTAKNFYAAAVGVVDASYLERDSSARAEFLMWGTDTISAVGKMVGHPGADVVDVNFGVSFDGATVLDDLYSMNRLYLTNYMRTVVVVGQGIALTEGYHYGTLCCASNTVAMHGSASPGDRCSIQVTVWG